MYFSTLLALPIFFQAPASDAAATSPAPAADGQLAIRAVERMAALPQPLAVRDWAAFAKVYYQQILNPAAAGDGFPAVRVDADRPGFFMKSYLGGPMDGESLTCLSAVAGARLAGLDPRDLDGVDYVARSKAWYDPSTGIYRHRVGERSPEVSADIYGYWAAIQGMILAAQYPDDGDFKQQALQAVKAFKAIAQGVGCPDHPNFDGLGWNFATQQPGGRSEPMNRLGHAPSVAWMLLAGNALTGDKTLDDYARSTMHWYSKHPGRYELSHVMGPLVAARLNAAGGEPLDMNAIFNAWFGDGAWAQHTWQVTAGRVIDGVTYDGLDGAWWGTEGAFYTFTMGSLQGPAWLVPVARYDSRYARAIARYALHAANSASYLTGLGLDAKHQDHSAWKSKWDPKNMLFYEGLRSWSPSEDRKLQPYATGDNAKEGWYNGKGRIAPNDYLAQKAAWIENTPANISLYMGNHIGYLGGILQLTDVAGILSWDCVATDWFHPPAYPTRLVFNPHPEAKTVVLDLGAKPVDLYDTVQKKFIGAGRKGLYRLNLAADTAAVIVSIPAGTPIAYQDGRVMAGGTVVDWRAQ